MDFRSIMASTWAAIRADGEAAREYFLLRDATRRAGGVSDANRQSLETALHRSDERAAAARASNRFGARAEALRLAIDAFVALRSHADEHCDGLFPSPTTVDERLKQTLLTLESAPSDAHDELFEDTLRVRDAMRARLVPLALGATGRKRLRRRRMVMALLTLTAVAAVAILWARRDRTVARASAFQGTEYRASRVLDGSEDTHWLLPPHTLGFIDFYLVPPRRVTTVSILNGYDPTTYGVNDFRLEAYAKDKLVKTHDATFLGQSPRPKPSFAHVPFPTFIDVDRVRLVVKSHRELGAGLAEVVIR